MRAASHSIRRLRFTWQRMPGHAGWTWGRVIERPFINMATGGFGTEITVETRPELKKVLKGAAY
jgi:diacylglycerol kinase family enzyme